MVKCSVIGCGLMGCKIAGDLALHGHRVKMYDSDIVILNSVCERIKEDKKELLKEGLLTQSVFSGSILCMSRLDECIDDAEFIFEVVTDDLEVKTHVLQEISRLSSEHAVISSNTLRLDIDQLAEFVGDRCKERFLGIRFLYPVYFIPEVEVTLSQSTSSKTLAQMRGLLEAMGKTLFFRSGKEPLILNDEQREYRKELARQEMWRSDGVTTKVCLVPELAASFSEGHWSSSLGGNWIDSAAGPAGAGGGPRASSLANIVYYSSNVVSGGPGAMVTSSPPASSGGECAICLDNPRDCLLEPCRHLILCHQCASMLLARNDYCPMCRSQIQSTGGVYLS